MNTEQWLEQYAKEHGLLGEFDGPKQFYWTIHHADMIAMLQAFAETYSGGRPS